MNVHQVSINVKYLVQYKLMCVMLLFESDTLYIELQVFLVIHVEIHNNTIL